MKNGDGRDEENTFPEREQSADDRIHREDLFFSLSSSEDAEVMLSEPLLQRTLRENEG